MSDVSKEIPKYKLIATICHHGFDYSGMSSGHYTANCKSSSGIWHEFDDTKVIPAMCCVDGRLLKHS
jgi:ubiquitin C-terminal hydrolase